MSKPRPNLVGQKFGKLTVLASLPKDPTKPRSGAPWSCLCDCGVTVTIRNEHMQHHRKSCGQCPKTAPAALHPFRHPRRVKGAKVRNCNICSKALPPTRYFNHKECNTHDNYAEDNIYDIDSDYQQHQAKAG